MGQVIVVTGANGFVGKEVCRRLVGQGHGVVGVVRRALNDIDGMQEWILGGSDFDGIEERWPSALTCDTVIHLAARVHVMRESAPDALAAYRATNVHGALRVARAARRAGARRFVFISSIKAMGEQSSGSPIPESDPPSPTDPYGVSKLEAERALCAYGQESGMEVVILRPPLVYGPGVRANFLKLMHAIAKGWPLPLGRIDAQRSMVYVANLADAIAKCTTDARAAGQTFHVADGQDRTVTQIALSLAKHLNSRSRLLPVPPELLRMIGRLTGRQAEIDRLIGELRLDCSHIQQVLDWHAPYSVDDGLNETARWYLTAR